jgi:hypothetical protein
MKIESIDYAGVRKDGLFKNEAGSVCTKGLVRMGAGQGCGLGTCKCSPGYWITIMLPRTPKGEVHGIRVLFKDKREFERFMRSGELEGSK